MIAVFELFGVYAWLWSALKDTTEVKITVSATAIEQKFEHTEIAVFFLPEMCLQKILADDYTHIAETFCPDLA